MLRTKNRTRIFGKNMGPNENQRKRRSHSKLHRCYRPSRESDSLEAEDVCSKPPADFLRPPILGRNPPTGTETALSPGPESSGLCNEPPPRGYLAVPQPEFEDQRIACQSLRVR